MENIMYNEITELSADEIESVVGGNGIVLIFKIAGETMKNAASNTYDKVMDIGKSIGESISAAAGGSTGSSA